MGEVDTGAEGSPLRKRPLGKTGLFASELSLGTWGLGGDAYGPVERTDAEAIVDRALEMGVSLFDTADAYGAGRVERLLGQKLAKRDDVVVVTRGGTDRTTDPARKRFDRQFLEGAVERSRKRLDRDRLDIYLLHNPSVDALQAGEAIDTLRELVTRGRIAHFGVSASDAEVGRAALDQGVALLSLPYNLLLATELHRLSGDLMVTGAGVLAHSVLAYGALAGSWAKDREFPGGDHRRDRWTRSELARRVEQVEGMQFLVQGDVTTMRGAAVRFALANHQISTVLLGPRSVTQLEQLVRETGGGPVYLADEALRSLPQRLRKLGVDL